MFAFLVCLIPSRPVWIGLMFGFGILLYLPGAWYSPTLVSLRHTGHHLKALVEALEKEGATLPQDSSIVILKHPHVASEPHNWVYRQLIFDVFLPEGKWKYLGDEQVDAADFIFEYIESGKNVVLHEKEGYPNATAKKTDETRMSIPQER